MLSGTPRPAWITFDCYGTLIQWDEGLRDAVRTILASKPQAIDPQRLIETYDRHEHALEQIQPIRRFRDIAGDALGRAMRELGATIADGDTTILADAISRMPPFPEVVDTLALLQAAGFRLCIISNTDDAIIAGNVAQLGGYIDRVITAEQAGAYKPSRRIFEHAHRVLGVTGDEVVHVCASPHLDLVATSELGLRDVWIDRGTGRQPADGYRPAAVLPTLDRLPALFQDAGWIPRTTREDEGLTNGP
jgi:2-haloacid dehalogenase